MGLWSGFTNAISSVAGGAGAQLKTFTGGGQYLSDEEKVKQESLQNTVKGALANVGKIVDATPAGDVIDAAKVHPLEQPAHSPKTRLKPLHV